MDEQRWRLAQSIAELISRLPVERLFLKRPYTNLQSIEIPKPLSNISQETAENPGLASRQGSGYSGTSQLSAAGRACLPCGSDHLSTVAGGLSEAMRFAREGGVEHPEVLSRITHAEDELNTFEREDGAPEKVVLLPPDEKRLMDEMLVASRRLRHEISHITSVDDLERAAADAQTTRREIRMRLFRLQLGRLPSEKREKIEQIMEQLKPESGEGSHAGSEDGATED